MAKGIVAKFVDDRGFGFIKEDGTAKEVFFHHSNFKGEPRVGMAVEYEVEASDRGPRAANVRPVE